MDDTKELIVFTDGACSNNGKASSAAAWAMIWPYHPEFDASGLVPHPPAPTNNRAELLAIVKAMQCARDMIDPTGEKPLDIFSDSLLAVNTMMSWMPTWKKRGWRKSDNQPVANLDLLQQLDILMQHRPFTRITHVKAHTRQTDWKSIQNDRVDKAARSALENAEKICMDIESNENHDVLNVGSYKKRKWGDSNSTDHDDNIDTDEQQNIPRFFVGRSEQTPMDM